jgi:DNA (cytosine-5)-methyltransferase 1
VNLTSLELCAGAGGQALGLEQAGFDHVALVEIDHHACNTLRQNRPSWNVIEQDIKKFDPSPYRGVDLVAAGLPCPPFSVAGKQLGKNDERNLFPAALRIIEKVQPRAIIIENVRGFLDAIFEDYRKSLKRQLSKLGYESDWKLLNASDFGVPQLRPRVVIVAMQQDFWPNFDWQDVPKVPAKTVGDALYEQMSASGWKGARLWREKANEVAPTIVGGSKKHGGPDLGPTRAKRAWKMLCVDAHGVANLPPHAHFVGLPKLTVEMVAVVQGFPPEWKFSGKKTNAYRQVGNAFPPPVAEWVGSRVARCLRSSFRTAVTA